MNGLLLKIFSTIKQRYLDYCLERDFEDDLDDKLFDELKKLFYDSDFDDELKSVFDGYLCDDSYDNLDSYLDDYLAGLLDKKGDFYYEL